ncbi:Peptidase S33 tripeptidyl aminopeptidase-like C-terminal [Penicillium sp. IBT 18751x]|nr:Peptidase S33 tripeptidyl aminopeptidase-like C-terminal [Penicillium sp. IBT 18751x]
MDGKLIDPRPLPTPLTFRSRRNIVGRSIIAVVVGLAYFWFVLLRSSAEPSVVVLESSFSWESTPPSESLEYHDCGDGFQCARLEVPMDYNRSDLNNRKFTLAVVRIPAKVPVGDPRYGGAVLINPGGPGGPGTLQAFLTGRNLQTIVDAESDPIFPAPESGDKYFDIIGFDPRGVGSTTPALTCFPDPISQRNWELQVLAEGMLGSGPESLARNWQRTQALNLGCSFWEMADLAHQNESMMEYVSTPLVARDMVTIIERHGEWREKEGLKAQASFDQTHGPDESRAILRRTQWHVDQEPLLYWGRSYGTLLGTTFAALFPDRIQRAVLDGVVNMDKYYENRGPSVLVDADAIFDQFGQYCNAAGSNDCPFFVEGGAQAIMDAYWTLEDQLLNTSIPVMASATRGPEVVTWTDLKTLLRVAVYQPLLAFPVLSYHMGELMKGNPVTMADFKHRSHFSACPSNECSIAGPWSPECSRGQDNSLYASAAILCTDAEYMTRLSIEEFEDEWNHLRADSATLGDYWAQLELSCVGWKAKAKYKFTGPWGGVTSHPMLFVANTLDPVTSLNNAQHMSQQFPGSRLLQQDSEGTNVDETQHTTVAAPSVCVAKSIRTYFQNGDLPAPGTLCEADLKPLVGAPQKAAALRHDMNDSDKKLFNALLADVHLGHWPGLPL